MPLTLATVPCLEDNYAFLIANDAGEAALVDAPEAAPINAELEKRGWSLKTVLLTHHHWDHVEGLDSLTGRDDLTVIGAKADEHRLPTLDHAYSDGDSFTLLGEEVQVFDVSGHTLGHIAFYLPASGLVFSGDSLMALGCGRLFEGSPELMHDSMNKFATLPETTLVCSGHEYTASNGRFAATVDPDNKALALRNIETAKIRAQGGFTVPSTLALERATNPFLRANEPSIKSAIGLPNATDKESFTKLRAMKDAF
ncbi:hydroxyacylglutathione hydrolase [Lentibacter algarum]|uniref:hydroxyacylglutathione hydrolase n=1 Tax=Lentibacter algarum TaxID=576131 RepID=UPI001C07B416|nr:hydroxyacylglutathione hydrolase [Lentibacter algarum]MBU2980965.1 hydroxyacylglutathione hydrolase [Lentibacter algarum]